MSEKNDGTPRGKRIESPAAACESITDYPHQITLRSKTRAEFIAALRRDVPEFEATVQGMRILLLAYILDAAADFGRCPQDDCAIGEFVCEMQGVLDALQGEATESEQAKGGS